MLFYMSEYIGQLFMKFMKFQFQLNIFFNNILKKMFMKFQLNIFLNNISLTLLLSKHVAFTVVIGWLYFYEHQWCCW